jgi:hypothetical protein
MKANNLSAGLALRIVPTPIAPITPDAPKLAVAEKHMGCFVHCEYATTYEKPILWRE